MSARKPETPPQPPPGRDPLDQIVPWGRSYEEYVRMFDLGAGDLERRIVGCGDGPASFNCEMRERGRRAISVDPLYVLSARDIERRIDAAYPKLLAAVRRNLSAFVWTDLGSPEELGRRRLAAMRKFLADYEVGRRAGRYVVASLPDLPFAAGRFDLALCSHLLFLYTAELDAEFHRRSIGEMCHVANEARIFPLLDLTGARSRLVDVVTRELERSCYRVELRKVPYEFQRGGDEMMVVRPPDS